MLVNLALIFLVGFLLGKLCTRIKLPALIGYLFAGLLLGDIFHLLSNDFLLLSAELRRFSLIVILLRAGLALDISALKQVGRPAVLLCFVPACFEILGCVLLAPHLLGLSILESALLGSVIAAVSPAVVVPRMLLMIEKKLGTRHGIPQMILAGASVDDVFVLVLFSAFCSMLQGGSFSPAMLLQIPISMVTGILAGILFGIFLAWVFQKISFPPSAMLLILLSIGFLVMAFEDGKWIPFSGMLCTMCMGTVLVMRSPEYKAILSPGLGSIWIGAEVLLFVLVGAAVQIIYLKSSGIAAVLLILGALCFRMVGTGCSVSGTKLSRKERLFTMIAYCPKATVQAAIGSVPLAMGFSCGHTILTAAVLAICITAPFGAAAIDFFMHKLLQAD